MAQVFAVGVGPGDPELLTRKGERVLRQAGVIMAPVTRPGEPSFALEIVRDLLDASRQELLLQHFPMTSSRDVLEQSWQEAAGQIARRVDDGQDVAFIAIGDPLFYATSIYLIGALRHSRPDIQIEVVPGISSINATAAAACLPLAENTDRVAVIPATVGLEKIAAALVHFDTVVLLKIKPLFQDILELLRQTGNRDNTLFAERVGMPGAVLLHDFSEIEKHQPDYLSLMIVKRVCSS